MVVLGQKLLYSGKLVVFWAKWLYSDENGCFQEIVVVFGKVVVVGQKLLYSGKNDCTLAKWFYSGKSG